MSEIWKKIKITAKKYWDDLSTKINAKLDAPEKRIGICCILVLIPPILLYFVALIQTGIWIGDGSIPGMFAAYRSGRSFPWLMYLFLLVALLSFFLYAILHSGEENDRNFELSDRNVYGNARQINSKELGNVASIQPPEESTGPILGQIDETNRRLITAIDNPNYNKNYLVFGPPGSGKSVCFVIPSIIEAIRRRESVVTTDTKGEIWAKTAEFARRNGYIVKRLDLKNPATSDGWAALSELRHDDVRAMIFADTIIKNTGDRSDVYSQGASALLRAICLYQERNPDIHDHNRTLANAAALLLRGEEKLANAFKLAAAIPELKAAVNAYNTFLTSSPNLRGNIITGLSTRLQLLQSEEIARMTGTDDIDLTLPAQKPCIYYVIMPDQHDTMRFIASLFFSFLFMNLADFADAQPNQQCPIPVNIKFEEFANVGELPNIDKKLNTLRARDINLSIVIQGISQLQNLYETTWSAIMTACATHICLGFNDKETSEYFEWRSGEATVKVKTEQHDINESVFTGRHRNSTGDGRRNFYTSNELMKTQERECLIVWQRYDTFLAKTFFYKNHPEYKSGHMPEISSVRRIKSENRSAKKYYNAMEDQRVADYEKWLQDGGNPWPDYADKPKHDGPCRNTPPPETIPLKDLEEISLQYEAGYEVNPMPRAWMVKAEALDLEDSDIQWGVVSPKIPAPAPDTGSQTEGFSDNPPTEKNGSSGPTAPPASGFNVGIPGQYNNMPSGTVTRGKGPKSNR